MGQEILAGKYKVLSLLGEGASGKVYLVQHRDIGVKYALKVLDQGLCDNIRFIERFKREAEVLLKFTHEGTIQLRDFGRTEDGHYYMAMDYCEGEVLKKIIQNLGLFNVEDALDIIIQLLSVLNAAHSLGIIHRDIKPDNLMLERNNKGKIVVKVLDFGVAKLRESVEVQGTVTMEGVSIGTPYYMSPEQASGEPDLDHRVDLYAVGIVLYELLTGIVPFKGKTVLQTLLMHLTHTAEPFATKLAIPEFVEQFVYRSIEKRKEDRFQSAEEFKRECEKVLVKYRDWQSSRTLRVEATERSQALLSAAPNLSDNTKGQTRILCLDDNEMILNILKHLLDQEGYQTFTASNCSAIHNHLFNDDIKLLISDVEMPDMRGTKVCQMLKRSLPELKIILFSNVPERDLEKMSNESKADAWISKNTKPTDWIAKIREVIAQS